jgi:NAD(P)-dependent dehydrogenase (short-subunit alcohol dehydrogenase family)
MGTTSFSPHVDLTHCRTPPPPCAPQEYKVTVVPADMARDEDVARLADACAAIRPELEVLILAAGVGTAGEFVTYPLRTLDKQIAVNLRAPFQLTQRLLPALRASAAAGAAAKVIAIASITGVAAEPGLAAYGATKAALISLCESITASEGAVGVTATAISPGYVDTDMTAWIRDQIPPANMITADDIAELTLAVCRLSRHSPVPNIVVTRPGPQLWRT